MRRRGALAGLIVLCVAICGTGLAYAQGSSAPAITDIEILDLAPFTASFRLSTSEALTGYAGGRMVLSDRSGETIDVVTVDRFVPAALDDEPEVVTSRWDFQQTGIYLLEITLDLGDGRLVSNSLAFRILPIRLPLHPQANVEGEGLYTVYQEPINWGITRIDAVDAWGITDGSPDVVVAVIDSGIDWTIPQLAQSLWVNPGEIPDNGIDDDGNGYVDDVHGWDFRDNDNSPLVGTPIHGHGTFVASIVAAQPGEQPIVGVAPGVRLMDVRFLDSSNSFQGSDWRTFVRAIEYAVDNGADIINLSIYANGKPPTYFEQAIADASSRGVIIVGIAGNLGQNQVMYPAKYSGVLAISATSESDLLASFSNRGSEVAVCAPGEDITSFTKGGRASTQSGTSFAAPHVSGVLALILSVSPNLTPSEAIGILESTASDLGARGRDDWYGNGLIDAFQAVRRATQP
jgi:subtilisin family serine protease